METDQHKTRDAASVLVATKAGNCVWRLIRVASEQPEWMRNQGDVLWDAMLIFDASGQRGTPRPDQVGIKNTVVFDAKRLGLLWNQVNVLVEELETWMNS